MLYSLIFTWCIFQCHKVPFFKVQFVSVKHISWVGVFSLVIMYTTMKYNKNQKPVEAATVVSAKDTSPSTLGNESSPFTSIVAAFSGPTCIKNIETKNEQRLWRVNQGHQFVNSNELFCYSFTWRIYHTGWSKTCALSGRRSGMTQCLSDRSNLK